MSTPTTVDLAQILRGSADGLLERETVLALIGQRIGAATEGEGGVIVLEGAAGAGKTALIRAAVGAAKAGGLSVATASGFELERDFPYGVVRQLFERRVAGATEGDRSRLLKGAAGLAAPLFDPAASRNPDPASLRHGLYWLTANLADESPLLVAVDDAQWADATSLEFLAYLVRRLEGLKVLVLLGMRQAVAEDQRELLQRITAEDVVTVASLEALSEAAVAHVVRKALGSDPADGFVRASHRATGGNPFLLRELLGELAAEGVCGTTREIAAVAKSGPKTLTRVALIRLARLSPDARELARSLAVLGQHASLSVAGRLASLTPDKVHAAADALADAGILARVDPPEFAHPIIRETIYRDLPSGIRARRHAAAARALGAEGAPAAVLAAHLVETEGEADPWAARVLRAAAAEALATGAPASAAQFAQRGLAEPPPPEEQLDLLLDLGRAQAQVQEMAAIQTLQQALAVAATPTARAAIALELGRVFSLFARFDDAARTLEEALGELGDEEAALRTRLQASLIATALTDLSQGNEIVDRLVDHRGRNGDDHPAILAGLAFAKIQAAGSAHEAAELALRALQDGQLLETFDPAVYGAAAGVLIWADRFDEADEAWDAALALASRRGSPILFAIASTSRSHAAYRRGALAEAEAHARAGLDQVVANEWHFAVPLPLTFLMDVLLERGELDAAREAIAQVPLSEPMLAVWQGALLLIQRGRLAVATGDPERGLKDLLDAGRRLVAGGMRNPATTPSWRAAAAVAYRRLGRQDEARAVAREELELARATRAPRAVGLALRAAAVVEEDSGTRLELLAESVNVLEASPARLELGHSLCELGAALRRANRRADARDPLRRAQEIAEHSGALPLANRAREELAATGARPRSVVVSGVDALTPSERRVAQQAAAGLSNREIAEALFVTLKTVESHLGHAYQKLGISSRDELRAFFKTSG